MPRMGCAPRYFSKALCGAVLLAIAPWAGPPTARPASAQPFPSSRPFPLRSAPPAELARSGSRPISPAAQEAWQAQLRRDQQRRLPLPVYVRVLAPKGTRVIFFSAGGKPHVFAAPVIVGLRARHRYLFAVENVSSLEPRRFYGTLEMLRGPNLPPDVKGSDAPIPLELTPEDGATLVRERLLTKFIVLEDPDKALGLASKPDEPIRYPAAVGSDPVKLAKDLGEIVLVARLGTRVPTTQELAEQTIAGSLIVPRRVAIERSDGKTTQAVTFVYADTGASLPGPSIGQASATDHSPPPAAGLRPRPEKRGQPRVLVPAHARSASVACPPGAGGCPPSNPPVAGMHRFGSPPDGAMATPLGPGLAANLREVHADLKDEYLCDGGDERPKVGHNQVGELVNVDPSDTIAEYRDTRGRRKYAESNCVCVYSPRYVEVRQEEGAEGYSARQIAALVHLEDEADVFLQVSTDAQGVRVDAPQGVRSRIRASGLASEQWASNFGEVRFLAAYEKRIGWAQTIGRDGPKDLAGADRAVLLQRVELAQKLTLVQFPQVLGMIEGAGEVKATWKAQESVLYEPPPRAPGCLQIEKAASVPNAKIGETVGFTIKFTNIGDEPVTNVAIVDSLTGRLEYVPRSAQSTLEAIFTTQPNEAGSEVLRWEIPQPLGPGESGMVYFEARIR